MFIYVTRLVKKFIKFNQFNIINAFLNLIKGFILHRTSQK